MTCNDMRSLLPGYLDGALKSGDHARLRQHLDACAECQQELTRYEKLSLLMSRVEPAAPPADLALSIRVAVSQARSSFGIARRLQRLSIRTQLVLQNFLEPLALPATGGILAAMLVFAVVYPGLALGLPLGAVPNDLPTSLLQPARLETLAPFPVSAAPANDDSRGNSTHTLVVEATVNAQGEVVGYQILAGPDNLSVRRQLDQVLLFSRFRPQMSFGRPTGGGRVVLSFSEVRVRG